MSWLMQNWIWIVVAIAVVLLMRRGGLAGCGMGHGHHGGSHGGSTGSTGGEDAPRTATDPVSGKEVSTQHAVTSYYGGRVYYFESTGTRQRFETSPEKYARPDDPPAHGAQHRHAS